MALRKKVKVDLHIHHYSTPLFKEIMEENLGKYQYYVIMPHFVSHTPTAQIILRSLKRSRRMS
jgi:hypothetical protein